MLMRNDRPPVIEVIDIDSCSSPHDMTPDWTDRCVYECYLCADGQTQTTGKSAFTDHLTSAHAYTFKMYITEIDSEPRRESETFTCYFCKKAMIWDTDVIVRHLDRQHKTNPDSYKQFMTKNGLDVELFM